MSVKHLWLPSACGHAPPAGDKCARPSHSLHSAEAQLPGPPAHRAQRLPLVPTSSALRPPFPSRAPPAPQSRSAFPGTVWPPYGSWATLPSRMWAMSAGYLVCLLRVSPGPAVHSGPPKHRQWRKAGQRPHVLTHLPGRGSSWLRGTHAAPLPGSSAWLHGQGASGTPNLWVLSQHRCQTPLGCQLPETFETAHRKEAGGVRQAAIAGLALAFHAMIQRRSRCRCMSADYCPSSCEFLKCHPFHQTHEKGKRRQVPHSHRGKIRLTT